MRPRIIQEKDSPECSEKLKTISKIEMKKRVLIPLIVIVAALLAIIIYSAASKPDSEVKLTTSVQKGDFEIIVSVTGELQAERSVEIEGPSNLRSRNLRLRGIKIQDMIAEGSVVDSGDWVATLDRSEADNSLKDISDELEKTESQYTKTKLDTTIQLRQLRDDLINLKFAKEEMKIALEQSQYEPPATIRQAQINLDKADRAYDQALKNYDLKVKQAQADMTEVTINLSKQERTRGEMEGVLKNFDIYAPAPGMVIYKREWNGQKRTVGSEINPWDLTVATLPDLSTLVSKTYVNEIDISKIASGQMVRVGVDAFPEKKFTGRVISVANIGEQLPNTDAKVFEVVIRLNENDTILRPSMTTSNQIITNKFNSVLSIPLEAVHTNDSLSYVYTTKGQRKVVVLGEANENEIIVEQGLDEGENIYLSIPDNPETFNWSGLDLVEIIKQKKAEEEKKKQEMEEHIKNRRGQRRNGNARPDGENFRPNRTRQ
jgi:multidrug efflux pump subunit AcrA (membrane-fusion protein)